MLEEAKSEKGGGCKNVLISDELSVRTAILGERRGMCGKGSV